MPPTCPSARPALAPRPPVVGVSIVIPAYNEQGSIAATVERVSAAASSLGVPCQIIVVNDGSRDGTGAVVRDLQTRMPRLELVEHFPNRGYGGSLRAGFAAAVHPWIAFLPGDNQFDPLELSRLIERASEADIVSGYRADRQDAAIRKLNAFGWNMAVTVLFGRLCRDIDCGFKLFRRDLLEHARVESNGAMIDTELLAGAKARGFVIANTPVTHLARTTGHPTGANVRVIVRAFGDLVRFRMRLSRELRDERRGGSR
jgi:glycosyltransferase involved in cell wall biosynthesis